MTDERRMIRVEMPPLPHFLGAGYARYRIGDEHPSRKNLGVFDWLCVVKGKLHIGEGDRQWTLGQGDALLLLPDREHYAVRPCESETEFYWIHLDVIGEWEETSEETAFRTRGFGEAMANPYTAYWPAYAKLPDPESAFRLLGGLLEESERSRPGAFWNEQRYLLQWFGLMEESRTTKKAWAAARVAERAEAFLKARFRENVTNEMLAEELHFHPNYVIRCMKAVYRVTPMEFLLGYRMEQAKRLLLTTDWSVARIAEDVGFRHAPYFSGCFKQVTGVSPLRYRKQFAG